MALTGCPTEGDPDASSSTDASSGLDAPALDAFVTPGLDAQLDAAMLDAPTPAFDVGELDAPGLDSFTVDASSDAPSSHDASSSDAPPVSDPRILSLSMGKYSGCVIDRMHRLWCWGRMDFPTRVSDWSDVVAVDVGPDSTCAVRADGLWCWGSNAALGATPVTTPVRITLPLPLPITALAVGGSHICATASDGTHCWGTGLGALDSDGVAPIATLPDTVQLAANDVSGCARDASGAGRCWGRAPVGDGSMIDRRRPVSVSGLTDAVDLQMGNNSGCAATATGGVCWGANHAGMRGDGTTTESAAPTPVLGAPYLEISQGWFHGVGLRPDGSVWEWGSLRGSPTPAVVLTPERVLGLPSVVHLQASDDGNCALATDGEVYCWGVGTLGRPSTSTRTPLRVTFPCEPACPSPMACVDGACVPPPPPPPTGDAGVAGAEVVSLGQRCAVHASGLVTCWGSGFFGDGAGEMSSSTPRVVPIGDAVEVTAWGTSACVLVDDGQVYCWGAFVGDGTSTTRTSPTRTIGMPAIAHLRGLHSTRAAIGVDGSVWMWGAIDSDFDADVVSTPRRVLGASDIVDGAFGYLGFCTLDSLGVVRCWPRGDEGSVETIVTDASITRLTGSGAAYACALGAQLRCWGAVPDFGTRTADVPIPGFAGARAACSSSDSLVVVDSFGDTYLGSRLLTGLPEAADCGDNRCVITAAGPVYCGPTVGGASAWSIRRTL